MTWQCVFENPRNKVASTLHGAFLSAVNSKTPGKVFAYAAPHGWEHNFRSLGDRSAHYTLRSGRDIRDAGIVTMGDEWRFDGGTFPARDNPRSPRAQLEALVWKHTHRDYRGVANGIKYVLVNTGAKVFGGGGGTEAWALSKLTDEQLCYQLPRSVREQHPELCSRAANPADLRYKTRAAFLRRGKWGWVTWEHREPSKHAAIIAKGRELGAQGWDFGNADHYSMADYPAGRGF